jgi:hypothetical protein
MIVYTAFANGGQSYVLSRVTEEVPARASIHMATYLLTSARSAICAHGRLLLDSVDNLVNLAVLVPSN